MYVPFYFYREEIYGNFILGEGMREVSLFASMTTTTTTTTHYAKRIFELFCALHQSDDADFQFIQELWVLLTFAD